MPNVKAAEITVSIRELIFGRSFKVDYGRSVRYSILSPPPLFTFSLKIIQCQDYPGHA